MKALRSVIAVVVLMMVYASVILAQQISITIDQIRANEQISGYVHDLPSKDYHDYKVVVYVHTDKWNIHPYANQDEGQSYASIQANGTWHIKTVKREFKADKMAALLVKQNYPEHSTVDNLEEIQHRAMVIKQLKGTQHYGDL